MNYSKYLIRQADIIPLECLDKKITIVGAGAIGSWVSLSLAKMGFLNQEVYDFDEVSTENMNCQFYPVGSIGKKKVSALSDLIHTFTGQHIKCYDHKVTKYDNINTDILITAVDSMKVRKLLDEISVRRFTIDPRMSAEYASMEVVDINRDGDMANYKKTLYSDAEAVQERCTAKATMYTVNLIAGQVVKAVKDIALEKPYIATFDWNIKENRITSFCPEGKPL